MDSQLQAYIKKIYRSSTVAAIAVSGGGSRAISWLLCVPGASGTVLDIRVPYAVGSLHELLGYRPHQLVSLETATVMARVAYESASRVRPADSHLVGIGCTSAIATDRARRGEHRCFVCAWTDSEVASYSVVLTKGLRDRIEEDEVVSKLILRALGEAGGLEYEFCIGLNKDESFESVKMNHTNVIEGLWSGMFDSVTCLPDGIFIADKPVLGGVLSGSFNPLHVGHEILASAASSILGDSVTFEMSVSNVDKADLNESEVRRRLAQFVGKSSVVVSRAATFLEKSKIFPGCLFVIGWDTASRIVEPYYYGGSYSGMKDALAAIDELGCRFMVAGRLEDGKFRTLDDLCIPLGFDNLFTPISETDFRCDVSSTELRVPG